MPSGASNIRKQGGPVSLIGPPTEERMGYFVAGVLVTLAVQYGWKAYKKWAGES